MEPRLHVCWNGEISDRVLVLLSDGVFFNYHVLFASLFCVAVLMQIFRKEPFFYGHDNQDQLVKIAKV